jgi:hypothetical protein
MRQVATLHSFAGALVLAACSLEYVPEPHDAAGGAAGASSTAASAGSTGSGGDAGSGGGDSTGGAAGAVGSTGGGGSAVTSGGGGGAGGGPSATGGSGGSAGTGGAGGGAAGGTVDAGPDVSTGGDACAAESDAALCTRLKKNCGTFTALDNCRVSRAAMCGTCTTPATCGGGGTLNVCSGGGAVNRATGGTVISSVATDNKPTEDKLKAFDNDTATKWFVTASMTPWIGYQFATGTTHAITSYTLTSANDMPTRDPMSWRLEGSNDAATWTPLDTRTGETFASRFQTNTYTFTNTTAYAAYRLFVTANGGAAQFQIAEIQLF